MGLGCLALQPAGSGQRMSVDAEHPIDQAKHWARHQEHRYANGEDRPLGGYVMANATFLGATAAGVGLIRLTKRSLPKSFEFRDLALLAVASHKLSRRLSKDAVTSPLRAPVTEFKGAAGPGEVQEEVVARGPAHAFGELITCPFCLDQWVVTAGMFGLVLAPRPTRFVASMFAVVAVTDLMQLAYGYAQKKAA